MRRRLLAAATAITVLTGGSAFLTGPADAARKPIFRLEVSSSSCSPCAAPNTRAQGEPLKILGYLRPGTRRPYLVQERAAGTWRTLPKKRGRASGVIAFHITHSGTGQYAIRAVAPRFHGDRRMVSNTVPWTVLLKTTVSGAFSANPAAANSSVVVSGQLSPAAARTVEVIPADPRTPARSLTSNADGTFAISVPTTGRGSYRYRVLVPATGTEAEAGFWLPTLDVG